MEGGRGGEPGPDVRMLWELSDPAATLRDRFGLEDGADAARWVAHVLDDAYGTHVQHCERIVMSDRNALAWVETDRRRLVVKWCIEPTRFARLEGLAHVVTRLAEAGLPVSAPVPALDGRPQVLVDGASVGVQRVIEGDLLDVHDEAAVLDAGITLASLHLQLEGDPEAGKVPGLPAMERSLREQILGWLEDPPSHLPADAVERLRSLVEAVPHTSMPAHLVHGDFRSANVLCREQRVVAVLDFEEARRDHPISELTRSAVLLGTQFHDWGPISARTRALLRQGYESVRPLSDVEGAWWEPLVLWWTLLFVPDGPDPTGWHVAVPG